MEKLSKENKGLAEQRDQLKAALSTPRRKVGACVAIVASGSVHSLSSGPSTVT